MRPVNYFIAIAAVIAAGAFLLYFLLLEFNYCLSADDFAGIDYSTLGFPGLGYAWRFYMGWEGPFLTMVIQGLSMWLVTKGISAWLVLITVKTLLVLSVYILVKSVFKRLDINVPSYVMAFASVIFCIALYLISPSKSEIWHWLIGAVYLYPLIFLMFGATLVLREKLLLAIIPLAFVMQSRATYAVLVFGAIVLLTGVAFFKGWKQKKRWLTMMLVLGVFLVIYLIAPGNYIRHAPHGKSLLVLLTQFKIGLYNLFLSFNLAKIDRVALGLFAVLPMLNLQNARLLPQKKWHWFVPALAYFGFTLVHEGLFVYITGYREWERVLSLHSFLFLVICFIYGAWLYAQIIPQRIGSKLLPLSLISTVALLAYLYEGYREELKSAKALKYEYVKRHEAIMKYQGDGDTMYVSSIDYNGVLYFEDFSENPDHWINHDFVKAYHLPFKVAATKPTP